MTTDENAKLLMCLPLVRITRVKDSSDQFFIINGSWSKTLDTPMDLYISFKPKNNANKLWISTYSKQFMLDNEEFVAKKIEINFNSNKKFFKLVVEKKKSVKLIVSKIPSKKNSENYALITDYEPCFKCGHPAFEHKNCDQTSLFTGTKRFNFSNFKIYKSSKNSLTKRKIVRTYHILNKFFKYDKIFKTRAFLLKNDKNRRSESNLLLNGEKEQWKRRPICNNNNNNNIRIISLNSRGLRSESEQNDDKMDTIALIINKLKKDIIYLQETNIVIIVITPLLQFSDFF